MIVSSTARMRTERPARYAKQLTSHLNRKFKTEWDSDAGRGSIVFKGQGNDSEDPKLAFDGQGTCTLVEGEGVLLIHLDAPEELVERFESIIGSHLVRFGEKEHLTVRFSRGDDTEGQTFGGQKD